MAEWFESFFGRDYVTRYARITDEATSERDVDAVVRLLGLEPPSAILDLACGYGRHAVRMAERGYAVAGFDLSSELLGIAQERAHERGVPLTLVKGDMRRLPFLREFDAVLSLFTSFGFFAEEDDHAHVLHGVHAALRENGLFLLDVINRDAVLQAFQPTQWQEIDGGYLLSENEFDPATSRISGRQVVLTAGGPVSEYPLYLRLFSAHEIRMLLEREGFDVVGLHGDLEGAPFTVGSPRVVALARRAQG